MRVTDHQSVHQNHHDAGDRADDRSMTVSDIEESYAQMAELLHRFEWADRLLTGRYRRDRFADVEGRVLDVACGIGTNFRYLPDDVDLVGIDISSEMLSKAEYNLTQSDLSGTLHQMDAQDLEFPDNSFDTVISSLATCTFPDPVAALQEMERVCKPGGTIRLVEHGRSNVGLLARYQVWRKDAHYAKAGCDWTQDPRALVAEAGLSVTETTSGVFGMITTFEIDA